MILELLNEIKQLKAMIFGMNQWMNIQINSYKDQITKLHTEIRILLTQTNILVNRIKQQEKQLKANKLI